jgi:bacteriorhodopsin
MNSLIFSFACAGVIAALCVMMKGKDNKETNSQYAVKVFAISAIVVFMVYTYMLGNTPACPEIETGEPPF